MKVISDLQVKIFGDGADIASILELSSKPFIKGFTTNPTLMRKAGVPDYASFAALVLQQIPDRPVSFEVLADDEETMERQARYMATWGSNVYIKIPVMNTQRVPMYDLVERLSQDGIQLNVTAVFTLEQTRRNRPEAGRRRRVECVDLCRKNRGHGARSAADHEPGG